MNGKGVCAPRVAARATSRKLAVPTASVHEVIEAEAPSARASHASTEPIEQLSSWGSGCSSGTSGTHAGAGGTHTHRQVQQNPVLAKKRDDQAPHAHARTFGQVVRSVRSTPTQSGITRRRRRQHYPAQGPGTGSAMHTVPLVLLPALLPPTAATGRWVAA